MDFELTDEQELVRNTVREFADAELAPIAAELDRDHRFPVETVPKLAGLSLLGMPYPEEVGGAGGDYVSYAIEIEEIARVCATTSVIVAGHTSLATWPIYKFGTPAQKDKYLYDMTSGRRLGAFALTEPGAGTDAGAGTCTAVLKGDEYVLNGSKIFITNAPYAEVYIVFAKTDPAQETHGMSAFIVEKDTPGFSVGEAEHKLGIRGSSTPPSISPTAASRRMRSWTGRARLQGRHADPRRRADLHRRAGAGHRPGRARRVGRLRKGTRPVRQADRGPAGCSVDDRRHGYRGERCPAPCLPRRIVRGQRPPLFHGRGDG